MEPINTWKSRSNNGLRSMYARSLLFFVFVFVFVSSVCSAASGDPSASPVNKPQGDKFSFFERVVPKQARVVVYRTQGGLQAGAATVFINDHYHASLTPGGYFEVCLPPGGAELGLRMVETGQRPKDSFDTITALNLSGGQTTFLRLREPSGARAVLLPVTQGDALPELQNTRQQIHTISRVPEAVECLEGGPAPVLETRLETKPQQINLAADALFDFGKSDRNSMSAAGRLSLDKLISQIKAQYMRIDRIHVVGHADPLGNDLINDRLSNERALTVRDYLLSNGLQGTQVTGQGKGSREPIATQCSRVISPASVQCNQANRRVVVEITGARR